MHILVQVFMEHDEVFPIVPDEAAGMVLEAFDLDPDEHSAAIVIGSTLRRGEAGAR